MCHYRKNWLGCSRFSAIPHLTLTVLVPLCFIFIPLVLFLGPLRELLGWTLFLVATSFLHWKMLCMIVWHTRNIFKVKPQFRHFCFLYFYRKLMHLLLANHYFVFQTNLFCDFLKHMDLILSCSSKAIKSSMCSWLQQPSSICMESVKWHIIGSTRELSVNNECRGAYRTWGVIQSKFL